MDCRLHLPPDGPRLALCGGISRPLFAGSGGLVDGRVDDRQLPNGVTNLGPYPLAAIMAPVNHQSWLRKPLSRELLGICPIHDQPSDSGCSDELKCRRPTERRHLSSLNAAPRLLGPWLLHGGLTSGPSCRSPRCIPASPPDVAAGGRCGESEQKRNRDQGAAAVHRLQLLLRLHLQAGPLRSTNRMAAVEFPCGQSRSPPCLPSADRWP